MISETITFNFKDAAQRERFLRRLDKELAFLQKRPAAFRVKTGSGWIVLQDEELAQIEAERNGTDYEGLYARSTE